MIKEAPMLITEKTASMKSFMKYKQWGVYSEWLMRVSWAVDGIVEQGEPGPSEQESRAKHTKLENFVNSFVKNSSAEIIAAEVEHQKYKLEESLCLDSKKSLLWWK